MSLPVPKLPFPTWAMVTPIKIYHEVEGEDGTVESLIYDGLCNLSEKHKTLVNSEKQLVTFSGHVILEGDVFGGEFSKGYIVVEGKTRPISYVSRFRNPDGSVFSTEVYLD